MVGTLPPSVAERGAENTRSGHCYMYMPRGRVCALCCCFFAAGGYIRAFGGVYNSSGATCNTFNPANPTQPSSNIDAPPITEFEKMFHAAFIRSLGQKDERDNNDVVPTTILEPRRVYNITEFSPEYRMAGGMLEDDRHLLGKIYSFANSSFEYGLGESTYIAAWTRMPRWSGIDSDSNWVVGVRDKPIVPPHFQFTFADIGTTKSWGYPEELIDKQVFRYVVAPLALELEPFNVYLIDGRWRVACACMSFLHAMSRGGDMERVLVLVHDYDRLDYHVIGTEIAMLQERSTKLAVFKLRPGIREDEVKDLYLRSMNSIL